MRSLTDCFISYSHADEGVAGSLFASLTAEGFSVFMDHRSVEPGAAWREVIRHNVCRSVVTVLLDSPASRGSAWVQQEAGMALASGSYLIPVSLDGRRELLPGWLEGLQVLRVARGPELQPQLDLVVDAVRKRVRGHEAVTRRPGSEVQTIHEKIIAIILADQFGGDTGNAGAWSRQYPRYLRIYWGAEPVRSDVSQGTSLTFTGLIVERLSKYIGKPGASMAAAVEASLSRAAQFILQSQDVSSGGFGRRSNRLTTRGEPKIEIDMRHTCWGIRALLAIDPVQYAQSIGSALDWLAWHAQRRDGFDRHCWTAAPLLSLLDDQRALAFPEWRKGCASLLHGVQTDLENDFSPSCAAWVRGEIGQKRWVATDNSLYVLYTLAERGTLSQALSAQVDQALRHLVRQLKNPAEDRLGLPLFTDTPEVGPSCQLLEIMHRSHYSNSDISIDHILRLRRFVAEEFNGSITMPLTFPWHLAGALDGPTAAWNG